MNETPSESAVARELSQPLPAAQVSPAVAALLAGSSPQKLMAARGIAPLRPADLAVALYQLSFDSDESVKQAAAAAPTTLPDKMLIAVMKEALAGPVLHFLGARLPETRAEAIELLLYNNQTPDTTFVMLARRLPVGMLDIICQNETRLLRCPAIVKTLFENPATRMSSVNRALELCARNNVEVDIPAYREMVDAIREDADATSGARDDIFRGTVEAIEKVTEVDVDALLLDGDESPEEMIAAMAAAAKAAALDAGTTDAAAATGNTDDEKKSSRSVIIDFSRLRIFEKVRLATLGNLYCRSNLLRDPNRLIAMAVIRSPKITDNEVVAAAASKAVHTDVIRYISNSREYLKMYSIRRALVTNPKCPLQQAIRLVSTLHLADVKRIAGSKSVASGLAATARRIVEQKEKS